MPPNSRATEPHGAWSSFPPQRERMPPAMRQNAGQDGGLPPPGFARQPQSYFTQGQREDLRPRIRIDREDAWLGCRRCRLLLV